MNQAELSEDDAQRFEAKVLVVHAQDDEVGGALETALFGRCLQHFREVHLLDFFLGTDDLRVLNLNANAVRDPDALRFNVKFTLGRLDQDPEGKRSVELAVNRDVTAKAVANKLANAQTQAVSVRVQLLMGVDLAEGLEELPLIFHSDSRSIVVHSDFEVSV